MKDNTLTLVKELQSKKKNYNDCYSSTEVKLTREWNKAINECVSVVKKFGSNYDPDIDDDYEDWDDEIYND